jgi:hypothetical protein
LGFFLNLNNDPIYMSFSNLIVGLQFIWPKKTMFYLGCMGSYLNLKLMVGYVGLHLNLNSIGQVCNSIVES